MHGGGFRKFDFVSASSEIYGACGGDYISILYMQQPMAHGQGQERRKLELTTRRPKHWVSMFQANSIDYFVIIDLVSPVPVDFMVRPLS